MEEVLCPNCHKKNEVHKFCIYCGHKLMDDDQIRLIQDNPGPHCLNCGRKVEKGQMSCKCGYELGDVNCPECNTKNAYANRVCTVCGKKLWTSDVYNYKYPERLFESHFINEKLPSALRNTSLEKRAKKGIGKNLYRYFQSDLNEQLRSVDKNLCEICSRWEVVSPNYCINCLGIIKPDEHSCSKCRKQSDEKRVEELKTTMDYTEPEFTDNELKWIAKIKNGAYRRSLAPAVGESQFEYRERLKWEFAENNMFKTKIKNSIISKRNEEERKRQKEQERKKREEEYRRYVEEQKERKRREMEYIRQYGGGYCNYSCRYCYEEYFDSHGGVVGDIDDEGYVEYNCRLGHSVSYGGFCKDYES